MKMWMFFMIGILVLLLLIVVWFDGLSLLYVCAYSFKFSSCCEEITNDQLSNNISRKPFRWSFELGKTHISFGDASLR